MVVSRIPRFVDAMKNIYVSLILLSVWDVGVTVLYVAKAPLGVKPLELPLSLFGTAIALFLGIAVNAGYARWWEARGLWGLLVNNSRSLARQALTMSNPGAGEAGGPAGESAGGPERTSLSRAMARAQIAYVMLIRTQLRGEPPAAEVQGFLTPALAAEIDGKANAANIVLTGIGRLAGRAQETGATDGFGRQRIESTLVDLANAQGGLERIRNTPLPNHYRVFPALFVRLFCILLPFAVVDDLRLFTPIGSALVSLMFLMALQIGRDLSEPFADDVHAMPMQAICRTIEIDLLQMMGEEAPKKLEPVEGVLW